MVLKFYTSMAKELKVKVRKFWGLIPRFVEVTGEKLVKWPPPVTRPQWTALPLIELLVSLTLKPVITPPSV